MWRQRHPLLERHVHKAPRPEQRRGSKCGVHAWSAFSFLDYKAASSEAIARKLRQTFYPNLTYEGFSEKFLTQPAMGSTVIPDLYL
jgi:hypothetical protein